MCAREVGAVQGAGQGVQVDLLAFLICGTMECCWLVSVSVVVSVVVYFYGQA